MKAILEFVKTVIEYFIAIAIILLCVALFCAPIVAGVIVFVKCLTDALSWWWFVLCVVGFILELSIWLAISEKRGWF